MPGMGEAKRKRGRYWREADARGFVDEHAASGLTVAAFAEAHGIPAQRLKRWRKRLGPQSAIAARHPRPKATGGLAAAIRFARVERVTPAAPSQAAAMVTVELGHARVTVPAGFDAATVRAVLQALSSMRCTR